MSITFSAHSLPTRAVLWHDESTVTAGNALANTADTSQQYNTYSAQSAAANGDSFTQSIFLRAGAYTFTTLGETTSASGQIAWALDGTTFAAGQDWYSASTTNNVIKTAAVTVAVDGYHTLRGTVTGKNASSSGYAIRLTKLTFKQAAD